MPKTRKNYSNEFKLHVINDRNNEYSNSTELQKAINETMSYCNNGRIPIKLNMSSVQYRTQKVIFNFFF